MHTTFAKYRPLLAEAFFIAGFYIALCTLALIFVALAGPLFDFKPGDSTVSWALWGGVVLYLLLTALFLQADKAEQMLELEDEQNFASDECTEWAFMSFVGAIALAVCIQFDFLFFGGMLATIAAGIGIIGFSG